jgi:membrane fusion protein (multidrug efflux system)
VHHLFFTSLIALGLLACEQETNKTVSKVFPTTSPAVIDTHSYVDYVAQIKSIKNIELRAKITGYLDVVHVDEGQAVSKGQLLFTIDNREYKQDLFKKRALLKSAQSEVRTAELELQNTKNLVEKGVVSKLSWNLPRISYPLPMQRKTRQVLSKKRHNSSCLTRKSRHLFLVSFIDCHTK